MHRPLLCTRPVAAIKRPTRADPVEQSAPRGLAAFTLRDHLLPRRRWRASLVDRSNRSTVLDHTDEINHLN